MEFLFLAADKPTPFWPTGAIVLLVITAMAVGGGIWRGRRIKKGKDT